VEGAETVQPPPLDEVRAVQPLAAEQADDGVGMMA